MGGEKGGVADEPGVDVLSLAASSGQLRWPRLTTSDDAVSVEERRSYGKQARKKAPRSSHAVYRSAADRRDPIETLVEQTANGVPELVPVRYGRMLVSPFAYFRGSSLSMTSDLAATPTSELTAQICGDANLCNFGVFASSEERLYFDIGDFDETTPGPWEWDVKRLASSIAVSGRDNGFAPDAREEIILGTVRAYRETMAGFARTSMLDVWRSQLGVDQLLGRFQFLLDEAKTPAVWHELSKAHAHDSHQPIENLSRPGETGPAIVADSPIAVRVKDSGLWTEPGAELNWIQGVVRSYVTTLPPELRHLLQHYRIEDLARKVVGIAAASRDTWIVLITDHVSTSPVLLQVRQAEVSVAERYLPKGAFSNHGQRVVYGQRLMQAEDDILLGWERDSRNGTVRDYYVRRLPDWRVSADVAGLTPAATELWGRMCGWALARAHARSGDRVAIAAYLGRSDAFDRAVVRYAEACADHNERDFAAMHRAVRKGRLAAEPPA